MVILLIPGDKVVKTGASRGAEKLVTRAGGPTKLLDSVEVVASYQLTKATRGEERPATLNKQPVKDDDILEIEIEGGHTVWTSVGRYVEEQTLLNPAAVTENGVAVEFAPSRTERGLKDIISAGLRILRLKQDSVDISADNLKSWPADLQEIASSLGLQKLPAWLVTKALIRLIESRLNPSPGLYSWENATSPATSAKRQAVGPDDVPSDESCIIFIHGTASSTIGSFGAFLTREASAEWSALTKRFGKRIFAFEHRTLSDSPIDNAIDLLRAIPRNARVCLVSHSRGGMVADLISLKSISSEAIADFRRGVSAGTEAREKTAEKRAETEAEDEYDRQRLAVLAQLLAEKQIRVERFVRCASPSRGTLLASENIDLFLSVITNLVGLIPGLSGSVVYDVIKRVTLQVVKNRTSPRLVPGIEAMLPDSPLVGLLNGVDQSAQGALGVIAGDVEGGNWLSRIGIYITDRFIYERGDNDLVVNTDSMFQGPLRDLMRYVFDKGVGVNHFNYFANERTRAALVEWLTSPVDQLSPLFREFEQDQVEPVPMLRAMTTRAGTDQPIVFVLPGIMGSHLKVADRVIWLNYLRLLRGGLGDLANINAENVGPDSLIGDYYRNLCEYLQVSHEVIPFAYDWRKSIGRAADFLAVEVESALARSKMPLRFVAHSMGGLVVRAMIARRPELWKRICERQGSRFVMLGTPNRGSFDIVESLLGTATTVQHLAMLDVTRNTSEVAAIVAGFPGALELLPHGDEYFQEGTWNGLKAKAPDLALPDFTRLADARKVLDELQPDVAIPHSDCVHYVAGTSSRTTEGLRIEEKGVVLTVTTEGDGRVTYRSGQLPGVSMWFMDAVHGDLACYEPGFPGIADLLDRGMTTRLSKAPPAVRGIDRVSYAFPKAELYPTETALVDGLLGRTHRPLSERGVQTGFRIGVSHSDLRYAKYPIVVGHYEGDTIVGAESQIDALLSGALSECYALGLYPGEFGTISVIVRPPSLLQRTLGIPSGAVVIGLGKWGELTAGQLGDLIRRAALEYAFQLRSRRSCPGEPEDSEARGLSVLLIGNNSTSNIATGDSVGAIIRGVAQANREIASRDESKPGIAEVEIIELYADTAIEAARAVRRLAKIIGDELNVTIEAEERLIKGRDGRVRLTPVYRGDAWRRWEISAIRKSASVPPFPLPLMNRLKDCLAKAECVDPDIAAALIDLALTGDQAVPAPLHEIRFVTLSDRARAEINQQQWQPELVNRLIRRSITRTRFEEKESRVLFELSVPNELKAWLTQVDNLVFVVDEETAAYPWELMNPGERPLCLAKGLVRQLQTASFRSRIGARAGSAALVLGDPIVSSPYQQLPGARAEAVAVRNLLQGRFNVTFGVEQTALEVLSDLFDGPYRIVHLAGHGHYESRRTGEGKERSGMVLDDGAFLTAVEIGQMQQVPELVFLNCCHIGQTGPESGPGKRSFEFNRLAASVSRELIEMGVRVVVAAGWAVDDEAARFFAEAFYVQMLGGASFGRALKTARNETHDQYPASNTWGAYQAYGDPDYRLDTTGSASAVLPESFVDADEFQEAVRNFVKGAGSRKSAGEQSGAKSQSDGLEELVRTCPREWLKQSDVMTTLGLAFGELHCLDVAMSYLNAALQSDATENRMTLKAVEQLLNYEVRHASASVAADRGKALGELETAIRRLRSFVELGETPERLALLGSAYKLAAVVSENKGKSTKFLVHSADFYRRAHERRSDLHSLDPYHVLQFITAEAILNRENHAGKSRLITECQNAVSIRYRNSPDFFEAVNLADAEFVQALLSGELGQPKMVVRLSQLYQEIIERTAPSRRQLDSTVRQFDTVQQLIEKLWPDNEKRRKLLGGLGSLKSAIGGPE